MPIYDSNTPVVPVAPSTPTQTVVPPVDTASMYGSFTYNGLFSAYLDGSPWECTYYSVLTGKADVVINSNDVIDPTLRQYIKINNFELRVIRPLESSINTGTGTSTIVGSANVYPVVAPVVSDIFIAPIEGNVLGVFELTSVERLTQFQESAWVITYTQICYSTADIIANYERFVVAELYFNVQMLINGSNPLMTASEYEQINNNGVVLKDLVMEYFNEFYDISSSTFLAPIPNSTSTYYDPHLVKFWNTFIDRDLYVGYEKPVEYDTKNSMFTNKYSTLFDAITMQSPSVLNNCVKAMREVTVNAFDASFQRHTLRISEIDYVIFPYVGGGVTTPQADLSIGSAVIGAMTGTLGKATVNAILAVLWAMDPTVVQNVLASINTLGVNGYIAANGTTSYPLLVNVVSQYGLSNVQALSTATYYPPYVFSLNFYYNFPGQTPMELLVTKAIASQPILSADLTSLINIRDTLTPLDRFYQIPIMAVLIQLAR